MKRFLVLLPLGLLCACSPKSATSDDYAIMARFDPSITTIPVATARATAPYASDTLKFTPGKYCQGFEQLFGQQSATARLELNLYDGNRYLLAGRYTYKNLVRTYNSIGNYVVRGHALTFVNKAGEETTWAITTSDPNSINVWGNLPLTRSACTTPPLKGADLEVATKKATEEQQASAPWVRPTDK